MQDNRRSLSGLCRDWNARHPDTLIDQLERWAPLLPQWILDNILDQLIFPVLHREVDAWNPLTDSIPIHSWIHPWLPLMGDRLEPLYLPIRTKLAQALQNWQPSDSSAKAVLLPWQKVFKPATWDAFMNKYIVPKLVTLMQQFMIDPRQQVLGRQTHFFFSRCDAHLSERLVVDPWEWFVAWMDMVPLPSMVAILEKTFFPKWLQVLNAWLNTNANYPEIQRWYSGWRSLLPPAILNHTIIKEKLTEGLIMIDRHLSGPAHAQQAAPPPPPPVNVNIEVGLSLDPQTTRPHRCVSPTRLCTIAVWPLRRRRWCPRSRMSSRRKRPNTICCLFP